MPVALSAGSSQPATREPGDLDDRVAGRRPVREEPPAAREDDRRRCLAAASISGRESWFPETATTGVPSRAIPGDDPRLVLRAALGQVADEEDRLSVREALERGQDEAVRMEVGGDHDRAVDRRGVLRRARRRPRSAA